MAMDINNHVAFHEAKFIDQNGVLRNSSVPVVQELARQRLDFLPERFIRVSPTADPIAAPSSELHEISHIEVPDPLPCIDMSKIQLGDDLEDRDRELTKLAGAAKDWGMFLIEKHGIEPKILDEVKDVVKGFFGLSFQEKKASVGSYLSVDNMGYGRNFVKSEDQPLDWIDRLTMKAAPRDATQGLRVWPQNPPNFREAVEKFVERARKICDSLLHALAETLSVDGQIFIKQFDEEKSEVNVRVNYYPPCPRPDLALGITEHSDASALSVLVQFEASGGLQVFKDMKWLTVQWPVDALLINVGDLMEILSNGRFRSSWHRAVTQRDVERFSVALFYNPPSEAEIEPLKDGKSNNNHHGYKKVVVGEYLQNYYKISPTPTKQAIKFAQI
ncbi:protein LATERAL BRANCHING OXIDOREDUCTASE 1-like [Coffea arabica]|uniref:Protein LATERAL BRANCHING OXIDOREDUCTASE 1-like n=1 Tax=Coffea arabica TaxID=13443 RepID=A0ABM4WV17_COFAR|nr:flavonol synthase/flavanone 3-hydroxylase-like [Coffea arabica]